MRLFLALFALLSFSQESAPPGGDLGALRKELETTQLPSVDARAAVDAVLDEAAKALAQRDAALASSAKFQADIDATESLLIGVRRDLADPGFPALALPPAGATLAELQKGLEQVQADLAVAREEVEERTREVERQATRRAALPDELARARQASAQAEEELPAAALPSTAPLEERARAAGAMARRDAAAAKVKALATEQALLEARIELAPLRRDRAQRRLTALTEATRVWLDATEASRRKEGEAALREAMAKRRETARQYPALEKLAQRNEDLASLRSGASGVGARLAATEDELLRGATELREVNERFEGTQRKFELAGLSDALGAVLERELARLPSPAGKRREARDLRRQLAEDQLSAIELEEDEARLETPEAYKELKAEVLAGVEKLGATLTPELDALADELLAARTGLVERLHPEVVRLVDAELSRIGQLEELADAAERFQGFIAERILWLRSSEGARLPTPDELEKIAFWFVDPDAWTSAWKKSLGELRARPLAPVSLALVAVLALLARRPLRSQLVALAERVRSYRTDGFGLTLKAFAATLVLAAPPVLFVLCAAWLLLAPGEQPGVAVAAGEALRRIALALFLLELLRHVARSKGLGEAHLRWPGAAARHIRLQLLWFVPFAIALAFGVRVLASPNAAGFGETAGRWLLGLGMVGVCTFTTLVLRPGGPVFLDLFRRSSEGLLQRSSWAWFGIAFAAPLAIAVMAVLGYGYGALELAHILANSYALILVIVLGYGSLLRWLRIERRRLLVEQARQRARARAEEEGGEATVNLDEEELNVAAIDTQTRRLFRMLSLGALALGLYLIWSSALPALHVLDRVHVWPELEIVEDDAGRIETAAGVAATEPAVPSEDASPASKLSSQLTAAADSESNERTLPSVVTLGNVLGALLILLLMAIAARNLPGLLEIMLLKRLPVDAGSRYAIGALVRYAIVIVGATAALGTIGIGWSSIQWLAAALTFGLGFGLQEIFANFVSGLIILLERPVRVGDIVTVADIEGRVSQIRMRSTTITDWDRRELLVPNREFITGSLINWTLSDTITRLVVPVGIAYGSDTRRARELLLKCARESEFALDDPKPTAIFREFADSSLLFHLRIFTRHRDLWPDATNDIHQRIDDAFRQAQIEIAFPQRDLHLRSAEPLAEALRVRAEAAQGTAPPRGKGGGAGAGAGGLA